VTHNIYILLHACSVTVRLVHSWAALRVQGLPMRNCAGNSNNLVPRSTKVSAIDVTPKVFFERLYWFQDWPYLRSESTVCVLPHPHFSRYNYFSIFVQCFSDMAPHCLSAHDLPCNLTKFVLTLFIFKSPNLMLTRTLNESSNLPRYFSRDLEWRVVYVCVRVRTCVWGCVWGCVCVCVTTIKTQIHAWKTPSIQGHLIWKCWIYYDKFKGHGLPRGVLTYFNSLKLPRPPHDRETLHCKLGPDPSTTMAG